MVIAKFLRRMFDAAYSKNRKIVVDLARQINLEAYSDDIQELLDFHNQKLATDKLIEMHEQEQDIEEFEFLDQSEDLMMVGNLTEGISLIERVL
ncbi:hypothetical protein TNCV_2719891 [Trichonephila clavipes]|nr:hypothetical protein TNCV_2719891 [Trichonephila clavipes]